MALFWITFGTNKLCKTFIFKLTQVFGFYFFITLSRYLCCQTFHLAQTNSINRILALSSSFSIKFLTAAPIPLSINTASWFLSSVRLLKYSFTRSSIVTSRCSPPLTQIILTFLSAAFLLSRSIADRLHEHVSKPGADELLALVRVLPLSLMIGLVPFLVCLVRKLSSQPQQSFPPPHALTASLWPGSTS